MKIRANVVKEIPYLEDEEKRFEQDCKELVLKLVSVPSF